MSDALVETFCVECEEPLGGPHLGTCRHSLVHGGVGIVTPEHCAIVVSDDEAWPLSIALRAQFDVANERELQRDEFSTDMDDALTPPEWIARIAKHVGRAVTMDPAEFRRELVIVGALAVAGIEAFDRRSQT